MSNNKLGLSRLVFIPVTIEFSGIREQTFWYFCRFWGQESPAHSWDDTFVLHEIWDLKGRPERLRLFTCLGADIAWRLLHLQVQRAGLRWLKGWTQAGTLLVCLYGLITLLRYLPSRTAGLWKGVPKTSISREAARRCVAFMI